MCEILVPVDLPFRKVWFYAAAVGGSFLMNCPITFHLEGSEILRLNHFELSIGGSSYVISTGSGRVSVPTRASENSIGVSLPTGSSAPINPFTLPISCDKIIAQFTEGTTGTSPLIFIRCMSSQIPF
jgi:hypothetical protein